MASQTNPVSVYQARINELEILLASLTKKRNLLGLLRFLAIIIAIASAWILWGYGHALAIISFVIFFAAFLRLVILDVKNKGSIENTKTLIDINKEEIKIAAHEYTHRYEGAALAPAVHAYASDLDIFGRASLYQYLNRANAEQGQRLFGEWLLDPSPEQQIALRQEAAKALCEKIEWRQQLQAYGIKNSITIATEDKIKKWLTEENHFINNSFWKNSRYLFPSISLIALALCIAGVIPTPIYFGIAFIFFVISGIASRKINSLYLVLSKIAPEVETFSDSIKWIEYLKIKNELVNTLQQQLAASGSKASSAIKQLNKILERLDLRLNPLVFIPLNTLLFWDLQQAFALEQWKISNKENLSRWITSLAEIEALNTIATMVFNHPQWQFPTIDNERGNLSANDLGHPLIEPGKRVSSSFSTHGINQLALVTGSNMAGKSTFLRSIGVNVVLAMMGAPVCAESLTLSSMKVMSSMRIADNLEENTSTFYAELKKLKSIIEAVNRNEKIFILLDEILRGTNSLDRHTGSKALIKQLIHQKAVGIIATHDIELAKLAEEFPENIHNYHFDVQVANEELFFDYKLKSGVCQSMNASILMKKIGIEL
ncbi:MAG: hypothetical protein QM764_24270 [Chitinophagaceae bacterium]